MHEKQVLFESEHLIVLGLEAQQQTRGAVFVTFNEFGFSPAGNQFWGEPLFAKLTNSAIGIVSKYPNWYPAADMQAALPPIRAAIAGRPVITYGHSQGGYGALKYAAALQADAVLAFCPQWSIDPDDVGGFDNRYTAHFSAGLDNGRRITAADIVPHSFVFFDPHERADVENIARMRDFPGLHEVICPFSGHETVRLISDSHTAASFLELADEQRAAATPAAQTASLLRRTLRAARPNSSTYYRNRSALLEREAKANLLATVAKTGIFTISDHARLQLAIRKQDIGEANRLFLTAPFSTIKNFGLIDAWNYVRDMQLPAAELRLALLLVDNCQDDAFMLLHAANSFIGLSMTKEAARLLTDIVLRFGFRNRMEAGHIQNFARILNLPWLVHQAEETLRRIA
jgi:hypothetical protein